MLSRLTEKTAPCAASTRSGSGVVGMYRAQKEGKSHCACCCAISGSSTELANLLGRKGDQPALPSAEQTPKRLPPSTFASVLLSIRDMRTLNCFRSLESAMVGTMSSSESADR